MGRIVLSLIAGVIFLIAAAFVARPALATPATCPDTGITVTAPDTALAARICDVARDGISLLNACNVPISGPLRIDVAETLPDDCLGLYHCGERRIEILSPEAMAASRRPDAGLANVPNDRYFDSILVHELAHAAFDDVPCPFGGCPATAEYVSYTMQVMSLTAEDRAGFEAGFDLARRVSHDEISAMTLFIAPEVFIRKAWAHLSQRGDACAYIGRIMTGDVLFDVERP